MARGSQFLTLVTMLRSELGQSSNVAVGVDNVARLKHEINKAYEKLAVGFDWPFLRKHFTKITLNAGQQHYNLPSDLDFDRIEGAWAWWDDLPHPLTRGITIDDYAAFDSSNDQRTDPALKWDIRYNGTTPQIEIWPIPSASGQELQFSGLRKVPRLVNDIDVCLLDDYAVVLDAAVNLQKDSTARQLKKAEAQERLDIAKANATSMDEDVNFARPAAHPDPFKNVTLRVR